MKNTIGKYVMIENIRIHYYQTSYTGQALVFIHGNSLAATQFSHQLDSSLSKDYRLIALDLPGHGLSEPIKNQDYSLPFYANVIKQFIATLQLHNPIIVGLSLGGNIAMQALASGLKSNGTVILSSVPISKPFKENIFLANANTAFFFEKSINKKTIEAFIKENNITNNEDKQNTFDAMHNTDGKARTDLAKTALQYEDYISETEFLKNNTTTIAFIFGSKETYNNIDALDTKQIKNLWRNKAQLIHNSNHLPQLTNAEDFNTILKEFLNDIGRQHTC